MGRLPFVWSHLVFEATHREPDSKEFGTKVHVRVVVVHVLEVRVGNTIGRGRPPAAVVANVADGCEGSDDVAAATGQAGKTVIIRAVSAIIPPRFALELGPSRGSSAYRSLQCIPLRSVWQMPATRANFQCSCIVVQSTIGGTVGGQFDIAP